MAEKITILGGGSFGTAVASHIAKKHAQNLETQVILYVRNEATLEEIATHHTNSRYAKNTILPANLTAVGLLPEAMADTNILQLHEVQNNAANGRVDYESLCQSIFKRLGTTTVEGY